MAADLQIRLFGGIHLTQNGVPLTNFVSNKAPALLAYLAVARRPHQREALAALLWGELADADAKNNLRQALSNLRRLLDPYLLITRDTVALNPESFISLDAAAFEQRLHASDGFPEETRAARLQEAVALYQGDFLAGFVVRDAPEFEDWMLAQRSRFRELALHALHTLTQFHLLRGDSARAIDTAARLLGIDSWREEAHRQLMLAQARSGQRSAALAQYETCRRILEKELGVKPSAETTALYERIRAAGDLPRHALPTPAVPLIGRTDEVNEIAKRLLDPHCRLLTLLGLGGSGKTRLAQAAAAQLQNEFLNGVCFAPLANVTTPGQLPFAIAGALRLDGSGENIADQFLNYLAEKEMLLVLDNFEHLAGSDANIHLLVSIFERAPDVKLLITSRERLNLQSEWLHEIKPLSGEDAVAVFRYYAGRVVPQAALAGDKALSAIRRACATVGHWPLALALAGGWARVMSYEEIAAALEGNMSLLSTTARDAPERHRSMQAVFDHSWQLLSPEEGRALAALSAFRGGFTGEAARAVAGASAAILSNLTDKSWVQRASGHRFELHELVRQYASGTLTDPEAVLDRHCAFFADLLAAREPLLRTARQMEVVEEMRVEADDIRLMWQTAVRVGRAEVFDKTLHSMFWMADIWGLYEEGLRLFEGALGCLKGKPGLEAVRGRLMARQGSLARLVGNYDEAEALFTEAEALSRAAGDASNQAYALRQLGFFPLMRGDVETGLRRLNESRQLYQAVNDLPRVADALISLGFAETRLGNFDRAGQLHQEAADILGEVGDEMGLAVAQSNLGDAVYYGGGLSQALTHYRAAVDIQRRYEDRRNLAVSLTDIASLLCELKQWDEALAASQESADLFREMGSRDGLMNALQGMAGALLGKGEAGQALLCFNEAISHGTQLNAEADLLTILVLGARLLQARGQVEDAALLLVSIKRNPAASALAMNSVETTLKELPAEVMARVEESGEVWSLGQMTEVIRQAARASA